MKQFTEANNGSEVQLATRDTFQIRLPENRTAGFRWAIQALPPFCQVTGDQFISPPAVLGAAGEHIWAIETRGPGTSELVLSYGRSWESQATREYKLTLSSKG